MMFFQVALDTIRTNGKLQSILPYLVTFLASQVCKCSFKDSSVIRLIRLDPIASGSNPSCAKLSFSVRIVASSL